MGSRDPGCSLPRRPVCCVPGQDQAWKQKKRSPGTPPTLPGSLSTARLRGGTTHSVQCSQRSSVHERVLRSIAGIRHQVCLRCGLALVGPALLLAHVLAGLIDRRLLMACAGDSGSRLRVCRTEWDNRWQLGTSRHAQKWHDHGSKHVPSRRRAVSDAVSAAAASVGAAFVLLPHPTRGEGEMSGE